MRSRNQYLHELQNKTLTYKKKLIPSILIFGSIHLICFNTERASFQGSRNLHSQIFSLLNNTENDIKKSNTNFDHIDFQKSMSLIISQIHIHSNTFAHSNCKFALM